MRRAGNHISFFSFFFNWNTFNKFRRIYLYNDLIRLKKIKITFPGDGLVISLSTGCHGDVMASGASLVHPQVDTIMVTPVCAHSLSFRPALVPIWAQLELKLSEKARLGLKIDIWGFLKRVKHFIYLFFENCLKFYL